MDHRRRNRRESCRQILRTGGSCHEGQSCSV